MNPLEQAIIGSISNALAGELTKLAANPDIITRFLDFASGGGHHHDNVDVAQDALDAYDAGHLTRDQAMRIVQICLEEDAKSKGQPIDIKAKRMEIETLFNR